MSDPLDYTARLKAKGLDSTGVTEEIARDMANTLGRHTLLIVEVVHDEVTKHADGAQQVKLACTRVEPVPAAQEDVVREFMRAIHRTHPAEAGQAVLKGTVDGPSVADAAVGLAAHVERDEDGEPDGVWDGSTDGPLPDAPEDPLDAPEEREDGIPDDEQEDDGRPWPGDEEPAGGAVTPVDFSAGSKARKG